MIFRNIRIFSWIGGSIFLLHCFDKNDENEDNEDNEDNDDQEDKGENLV